MTDANSETTVPSPEPDPGAEEAAQFESDLASLQRERDDLLDTTRRLQADFENYRKRVVREQTSLVERAASTGTRQLRARGEESRRQRRGREGAQGHRPRLRRAGRGDGAGGTRA